jgi:hypothetical protein
MTYKVLNKLKIRRLQIIRRWVCWRQRESRDRIIGTLSLIKFPGARENPQRQRFLVFLRLVFQNRKFTIKPSGDAVAAASRVSPFFRFFGRLEI